jgi:hypothetical protein
VDEDEDEDVDEDDGDDEDDDEDEDEADDILIRTNEIETTGMKLFLILYCIWFKSKYSFQFCYFWYSSIPPNRKLK